MDSQVANKMIFPQVLLIAHLHMFVWHVSNSWLWFWYSFLNIDLFYNLYLTTYFTTLYLQHLQLIFKMWNLMPFCLCDAIVSKIRLCQFKMPAILKFNNWLYGSKMWFWCFFMAQCYTKIQKFSKMNIQMVISSRRHTNWEPVIVQVTKGWEKVTLLANSELGMLASPVFADSHSTRDNGCIW